MSFSYSATPVMNKIVEEISDSLNRVGILYRIFSRVKNKESRNKKLKDPKYGTTKKMQDLIGIRIVLYFNDDIKTVRKLISNKFEELSKDSSIDDFGTDEFKAVRFNIVYKLHESLAEKLYFKDEHRIDKTFELQIRTIFSEGWHEVEHDLRYKCKSDWDNNHNESRKLNGIYATLETSEWTMIKIFDELAYNHYKNQDLLGMMRQKFRLRIIDKDISDDIKDIVLTEAGLLKDIFRVNRNKLLLAMAEREFYYPLTFDNIIYFSNIVFIHNDKLLSVTPNTMIEEMTK